MISVREAAESIKLLRDRLGGDFKELLDRIERSIGLCVNCNGYGYYLNTVPVPNNYKVRKLRDGNTIYQHTCHLCRGKGQLLEDSSCRSCNSPFSDKAFERIPVVAAGVNTVNTVGYCPSCAEALERRFGMVPLDVEEPKPVPPPVPNKVDEAHKEVARELDLPPDDPKKETIADRRKKGGKR